MLLVEGRAHVVENSERIVRSPSVEMFVPEVIRLNEYIHVPFKTKIPVTNKGVLKRDGYKCAYCGDKATTVDHIRPTSKGGKNTWTNVVAACIPCNSKKGNTQLSKLGWELKTKPFVPEGETWLVFSYKDKEKWKPYLTNVNANS